MTNNLSSEHGFTLLEIFAVIGIICVLMALIFPVLGMIRESARRQHAYAIVRDIQMSARIYSSEDPQRRFPTADPDQLVRYDPSGYTFHILNVIFDQSQSAGLQRFVPDPNNAAFKVLVDPWSRPYRYSVDTGGGVTPDSTAVPQPLRPDPAKLDWNARNLVPYGYAWSLGPPLHSHFGCMTNDPDELAVNAKNWIYLANTAESGNP